MEQIGQGGFGTVWKARDTKLDRLVAVKIPRQDAILSTEIEQFLREARAAAQMSHTGIVSVFEVGRHDDTLYIVNDFGHLIAPNVLLRQSDGALIDDSEAALLGFPARGMGLAAGDLNGDGLPDLIVADWDHLWLMESLPDGTL